MRRATPRGASVGACSWGFAANGNTVTVELADGERVTADRVKFVEVIGAGAHPYLDCSDIDTTGTSGGFSILEESIVQAN